MHVTKLQFDIHLTVQFGHIYCNQG